MQSFVVFPNNNSCKHCNSRSIFKEFLTRFWKPRVIFWLLRGVDSDCLANSELLKAPCCTPVRNHHYKLPHPSWTPHKYLHPIPRSLRARFFPPPGIIVATYPPVLYLSLSRREKIRRCTGGRYILRVGGLYIENSLVRGEVYEFLASSVWREGDRIFHTGKMRAEGTGTWRADCVLLGLMEKRRDETGKRSN